MKILAKIAYLICLFLTIDSAAKSSKTIAKAKAGITNVTQSLQSLRPAKSAAQFELLALQRAIESAPLRALQIRRDKANRIWQNYQRLYDTTERNNRSFKKAFATALKSHKKRAKKEFAKKAKNAKKEFEAAKKFNSSQKRLFRALFARCQERIRQLQQQAQKVQRAAMPAQAPTRPAKILAQNTQRQLQQAAHRRKLQEEQNLQRQLQQEALWQAAAIPVAVTPKIANPTNNVAPKTATSPSAPQEQKPSMPMPALVNCPICLEAVPGSQAYRLSCNHIYCNTCLTALVKAAKDDPLGQLVCSDRSCRKPYSHADIQAIVKDRSQLQAIENRLFNQALAQNPHAKHCPTPGCSYAYIYDGARPATVRCPQCNHSHCTQCHNNHPESQTCHAFAQGTKNNENDRLFDNWKKQHDVRPCPKCKKPIQREAGCRFMSCSQCKHKFCWDCMRPWADHQNKKHMAQCEKLRKK